MNREIKFRAWDGTKMYDKVSALYPLYFNNGKYPIRVDDGPKDFPITALSIMQYTGLKDKNGAEIYEGDIVAFIDDYFLNKGAVEYDAENWSYYFTNRHVVDMDEIDISQVEVIGNIYENPELL